MMWSFRWVGLLLLGCLAACQTSEPKSGSPSAKPKAASTPVAVDGPVARVNWSDAGDCRNMIPILGRGLNEGWIIGLEETPFALIHDPVSPVGGFRPTFSRDAWHGASSSAATAEARCVLRVGPPGEHQSEHRVLGREQVRSRYQSGTRSEKNPAYEVAKARLRQAEKGAKPGKSSIVKVGDPLIDLVGTLVGGALTGFGQWGAGDQLEEALDALMATPPSIDHPVYKSYHFERAQVRASREAVLPIILTDRQSQESWQVSLKQRERRNVFVVNGLDRQDEDYARYSQDSLTEPGLRQWLAEPPSPPLADIAAVLLDRPSAVPVDRLALAGDGEVPNGAEPFAGDQGLDAAALPASRTFVPRQDISDGSPSKNVGSSSRIKIIGEAVEAEGVFIAPHFILTPSAVIGERGLIDIQDDPGHRALGLVAAVDHGLGLALIQAPLAGEPVAVARRVPARIPSNGGLFERSSGPRSAPLSSESGVGAPILIGGKLAGFRTKTGPDIESEAIDMFLNKQRHLLPVDHQSK